MLDFSWTHILVLLFVALVVVGPKDLPRLMRILGQWMSKARRMADEFRKSFDDMARQTELDELRKEIENLRADRPLAGIEHDRNPSILPHDMTSNPATPIETETAPPEIHVEPHVPETVDEPLPADGYKPAPP